MFNPQAHRAEPSTRVLVFRQSLAAAFKSLRQSMPAAPESLPALLASCGTAGALGRPGCREALQEIGARLFHIPGRDVEGQAWWHESLASAVFAARVAQLKQVSVTSSFMGALLYRAGDALALKILARVELEYRMKLDSASRREWCATHSAELVERLIRTWNLPAPPAGMPSGELTAAAGESHAVYFGRLFAIELLQPEFCVPGALDHAAADLGLSAEHVAEVRKEDARALIRAMD
jgi:HDOD domain